MKRGGFKKYPYDIALARAKELEASKRAAKQLKIATEPTTRKRRSFSSRHEPTEWEKTRAKLKVEFEQRGIIHCEFSFIKHECTDFALSFAHCKKRRLLQEGDMYHVALACHIAHQILDEKLSHVEMHRAVHTAIDNHGGVIVPKMLSRGENNIKSVLTEADYRKWE